MRQGIELFYLQRKRNNMCADSPQFLITHLWFYSGVTQHTCNREYTWMLMFSRLPVSGASFFHHAGEQSLNHSFQLARYMTLRTDKLSPVTYCIAKCWFVGWCLTGILNILYKLFMSFQILMELLRWKFIINLGRSTFLSNWLVWKECMAGELMVWEEIPERKNSIFWENHKIFWIKIVAVGMDKVPGSGDILVQ